MTAPLVAPPGLKGVVVADTAVGDVRGTEGFHHYRQYDATALAVERSFEEVCHLLIEGHLPDTDELAAFTKELTELATLPPELLALLPAVARSGSDRGTLARFRTAVSHLGSLDDLGATWGQDHDQVRRAVLRAIATTPTMLTALHQLRAGHDIGRPRPELGTAGNWLWQVTGREPSPEHIRAINRYLVCTIDHGFNASTFTARVVASAGADVAGAFCGALATFAGPLHGGAPDRALDALDEIGTPDRTAAWVRDKIDAGDRVMGFGHAVYTAADPRARLMRRTAEGLGGDLITFAVQVEDQVVATLAELKPGRDLHVNVEFYAGVVMELCGVPRELFTPTFAVARVVGWGAHILEQTAGTKIFRPSARYTGPAPIRASKAP